MHWVGYATWKMGEVPEAERYLRVARNQLKTSHPLDADAAYLLGRIREQQGDAKEAASFFQAVLTSHPGTPVARLSRWGAAWLESRWGRTPRGSRIFTSW